MPILCQIYETGKKKLGSQTSGLFAYHSAIRDGSCVIDGNSIGRTSWNPESGNPAL